MRTRVPVIDQASLTGLLLEEFIQDRHYLPHDASAIHALDELPGRLRVHAKAVGNSAQWRAWCNDSRTWFVIGRLVNEPRMGMQEAALRIVFYDCDGATVACAVWLRRSTRRWVLYQILDPMQSAEGAQGQADAAATGAT